MKVLDIALKDMTQSFRSLFAVMFMFVVPILMTGMFALMFGNESDEPEDGFSLPVTKVILVNQDSGSFAESAAQTGFEQGAATPEMESIGQVVTTLLTSEALSDLMTVSLENEVATAKNAVDQQTAGVAVILPENLTAALLNPEGRAQIELYQDPALQVGPAIVKGIITQILDQFTGSKITLKVAFEQLEQHGQTVDEAQIQAVVAQYLAGLQSEQSNGAAQAGSIRVRAPKTETPGAAQPVSMVAMMMTGMSIFYIFFTGASTAQTILIEEEKGTLPRLFTTPTPTTTILQGKFLSIGMTIIVQIMVLLGFGNLVFGIDWGAFGPVAILSIAITLAAAGFGIFLISLIQSTRQAGFVIGGGVTILGMAGMLPIFTQGMPNQPAFLKTISHLVPQGWAIEGLQAAMNGALLADMGLTLIVLLGWALIFFSIGAIRFQKRYA